MQKYQSIFLFLTTDKTTTNHNNNSLNCKWIFKGDADRDKNRFPDDRYGPNRYPMPDRYPMNGYRPDYGNGYG